MNKIERKTKHPASARRGRTPEGVHRLDNKPDFKAVPQRWILERIFAWLTPWHFLARDYQQRLDVSESMIHCRNGKPHAVKHLPLITLSNQLWVLEPGPA